MRNPKKKEKDFNPSLLKAHPHKTNKQTIKRGWEIVVFALLNEF